MPATRKQVPDGTIAALSHSKGRTSLPGSNTDGLPYVLFHQHESLFAPSEEDTLLEAPSPRRGSKDATQQGRHFLAILLGSRQAHLLAEAQLQPFQWNWQGVWIERLSLKQRSCQMRRIGGGESMRPADCVACCC